VNIGRIYTEAELRRRIEERGEQLAQSLAGRLRDDGAFDPVNWTFPATVAADGSIRITNEETLEFFRSKFYDYGAVLIPETIKATLDVLFDDDEDEPAG
jgi:hypothetical protein